MIELTHEDRARGYFIDRQGNPRACATLVNPQDHVWGNEWEPEDEPTAKATPLIRPEPMSPTR